MDNDSVVLRKVAVALILLSVLDTFLGFYSLANKFEYSPRIIFSGIVAGLFLLRKNITAIKVVSFFSALLFTVTIGTQILRLFVQPIELWILQTRLNPMAITSEIMTIATIALSGWVYKQLKDPSIALMLVQAKKSVRYPYAPFKLGAVMLVVFAHGAYLMIWGDAGVIARRLAQEQMGTDYRYHVTGIGREGKVGWARVVAYNDRTIEKLKVKWDEPEASRFTSYSVNLN